MKNDLLIDNQGGTARPAEGFAEDEVFVAELEQALLAGRLHIAVEPLNDVMLVERERQEMQTRQPIDAAVHSLKDLPGQLAAGLTLAAITERADARDVLVSRQGYTLDQLPQGARVATSSLRRRAQLLHQRPDLQIVEIRGNIDTRLRKALAPDGPDALILAAAGLERLGLAEYITEYLPLEVMLPAAGQGALAVEVRAADKPIGVYASVEGQGESEHLLLRAMVASPDGARLLRREGRGPLEAPEELGRTVARALLAAGAGELLAEGRADTAGRM
jgi:hydroxymethylbilane synthase